MIAQYTQAGIVSELKRLAAPASVDSIPTSAMQEDHVSMGWSAARKLRRSIDGLQRVLAIELLTAARGIELRGEKPAPVTGRVIAAMRETIPGPGPDRYLAPEIAAAVALVVSGSPCCRVRPKENHEVTSGPRPVRAHRGTQLHTLGWPQEAALRMLQNNLDPEVAEHPDELVVYGGTGKAARDWAASTRIVRTLETLKGDETMLVQSGRPVGVMQTHEWAPRVLIANSNLVGDWANWDEFRRLEKLGLTMYGQMTAGSWIYIGTQGILQGTYETFSAVAAQAVRRHARRARSPSPPASAAWAARSRSPSTMNDGVAICVDVDPSRIARRIEHGYLDVEADVDRGRPRRCAYAARDAGSRSRSGCSATPRPSSRAAGARRRDRHRHRPDQRARSARATCRSSTRSRSGTRRARADPTGSRMPPATRWRSTSRRWSASRRRAPRSSTTATTSAPRRSTAGYADAFAFPGFVPAYIRPLFSEGKGPFRWAALSGDPKDIAATDRAVLELFPENESLRRWITMARRARALPGPARPHLLARLRRARRRGAALQRHGRLAARSARRS